MKIWKILEIEYLENSDKWKLEERRGNKKSEFKKQKICQFWSNL